MKSTELTALIVAASLMVGGTYAWQSFSQEAVNEMVDATKEPGGRLHDYFDGSNKDVFVENYTPVGTGDDIYARIQLREYMEYGTDAGDITGSSSDIKLLRGDVEKTTTPVITNTDSWDVHLYNSQPVQGIDSIRTFRELELGGSTIYLPTFNQDNTDLTADINGTLEGTNGIGRTDPAESYTDYVEYIEGTSYSGTLVTADDTTGISATHTAKATEDSTIMTMADWVAADGPIGDYWVYDTDGWAYWATPIKPDTATGLLLDEIIVTGNPEEKWYYAISVVAQLATAGDWGDDSLETGMYGDISNDGLGLLNKVSGLLKVSSLVVTNDGVSIPNTTFNLPYVNGLNLIPELTVEYGTGASYETEVEWSITEILGNSGVSLDSIFGDGKFTPTKDMIGSTYEITVTSVLTPSRTITYTITVIDIPEAIEIATEDDVVDVRNTESLQLYAYEENTTNPVSVTWSISEASGTSGLTQEEISACLDDDGFFIPRDEMIGCTYIVKITSPITTVAPDTKTISVYDDNSASLTVSSAGNVTSMTLSPTYYELQMSTTITGLLDKSVEWTIVENSGNSGLSQAQINATLDDDGLFTVEDTMVACSYTITATSKVDGSFYDSMTISIMAPTIRVYTDDNIEDLDDGDTVQYKVEIVGLRNDDVKWSLGDNSSDTGTIDENGLLAVSGDYGKLVVTVTMESNTNLKDSEDLVIGYRIPGSTYEELEEIVGTTKTVKSIDINENDLEYYVLDAKSVEEYSEVGVYQKNKEAVLLWAKEEVMINGVTTIPFHSENISTWGTSDMNTTTLPLWLSEQTNLKNRVVRVLISTDGYYNNATDITIPTGAVTEEITYNEAYLLSQPEFLDYIGLTIETRNMIEGECWLRSPNTAMRVCVWQYISHWDSISLSDNQATWTTTASLHPVLWVVP